MGQKKKKKKKRSSPILRGSWHDKSMENQPKIWQVSEKMGDEQKKRSSPIFTASCKVLKNFRRAPKKSQGRKNRDSPQAALALATPLHGAPNFFWPWAPNFLNPALIPSSQYAPG